MDGKIFTENYKGKEILVVDYTKLQFGDVNALMEKAKSKIMNSGKKDILLLEIVRDIKTDKDTSSNLKRYTKEINPFVSKYAIVGLSGLPKILASTLRIVKLISFELFDNESKAKDYLTS